MIKKEHLFVLQERLNKTVPIIQNALIEVEDSEELTSSEKKSAHEGLSHISKATAMYLTYLESALGHYETHEGTRFLEQLQPIEQHLISTETLCLELNEEVKQ